jgi:hypothetical protein
MDALDLFFKKFSYKFDKGYPDLNNKTDMILLESLLSEILNEKLSLSEGTEKSNTQKATDILVQKYPDMFGKQSNVYRLANKNKISSEEFVNIIKKEFNNVNVKVSPPGTPPNVKPFGSRKFTLYEFETEDGLVRILLSSGGNEGEKYEQDFVAKAKANTGTSNDELPNDLKTLYDKLGIDNTKLKPEDIDFEGHGEGKSTKRSLNFKGPQDVGSTISDLTITYNNNKYYISLKNKAGSGVYSGPSIPFIYEKDGKVIYDKSKLNDNESIATLFDIFNIDSQKLADGLNNYVNKKGEETKFQKITIDNEKFKNLLASSLGYGYYYVRETKAGEVKVIPLLTPKAAMDAIGTITNVEIKYPGPTTKQLTMKIDTNKPNKEDVVSPLDGTPENTEETLVSPFGPSQYQVAIRNTAGNLLPLSLRISKTS